MTKVSNCFQRLSMESESDLVWNKGFFLRIHQPVGDSSQDSPGPPAIASEPWYKSGQNFRQPKLVCPDKFVGFPDKKLGNCFLCWQKSEVERWTSAISILYYFILYFHQITSSAWCDLKIPSSPLIELSRVNSEHFWALQLQWGEKELH